MTYTSTPAHSLIGGLHMTSGPMDLWLSPTSVDCPNSSVGSWPPSHPGYFSSFQDLRQELVHPKDPVPANCRKGVVYSIPCAECPRTYIGQMGRSLDHRLREHHRALKNKDLGSSALAVFSSNHWVDLSKAMVNDTHNHTQTHCMLESWHIKHHQSPLNKERRTLPELYPALLTCPYIHLASSHYCVITIINLFLFSFNSPIISLVSFLLSCTRSCLIVMLILLPPPPFPFV